jgi:hypothetical protein
MAEERRLAARRRSAAAGVRADELRHDLVHPIHRPEEAALRLAEAETAAKLSHRLALEEYERAALAHEDAARAHERAADLMSIRGDAEREAAHRDAAVKERAAANDARRVARAHASDALASDGY